MTHGSRWISLALCLVLLPAPSLQSANGPADARTRLIVKFRAEQQFAKAGNAVQAAVPSVNRLFARYAVSDVEPLFPPANANAALRTSLGMDRIFVLHFPEGPEVTAMAEEFSLDPSVEYAEPDHAGTMAGIGAADSLIPNDTYFYRQWALRNTGNTTDVGAGKAGADIKAIYAWPICTGDSNVIVGILDTGLKWDHPDIASRVWTNRGEIPGNGIDDDHNGYVDDVRGWNFAYGNNNVSDDEGHGTNVAGIIGAKSNNNMGYAGIDWHCKIMPLKVLDSMGNGYYSSWASAFYYAANNGARVLNLSAGGASASSILETAIAYAHGLGCFTAVAMMNYNDNVKYYPAAYDSIVVAVGATDIYDQRCSPFFWGGGSCYGDWIDVVAPGNTIYGLNNTSNTDYSWYWGGTSQATPMVSGLAALLLAQNGSRGPETLRAIIEATADDQVGRTNEDTPGYDIYMGHGRINCYRALTYAPNGVDPGHKALPAHFALEQNFPNPFNPTTTIRYTIGGVVALSGAHLSGVEGPVFTNVRLVVYDVLGRKVASLVDERKAPGSYEVRFHASHLASGVYFYRLDVAPVSAANRPSYIATRKLVLLK